jgi:hypothetical protein
MSTATIVRPAPASRPRNGLPEWKPYVYRGLDVDVLTPELNDDEPPVPDGRLPCHCDGSMRAYRKHLADGEDPCQASRDDVNLYHRERRQAKSANACDACGYKRGSRNCRTLCGGAR